MKPHAVPWTTSPSLRAPSYLYIRGSGVGLLGSNSGLRVSCVSAFNLPAPLSLLCDTETRTGPTSSNRRKLEPGARPMGMQNGAAAVENSLAVPKNMKHRITIRSSNSTSATLPPRAVSRHWNRYLHTHVHSSIFTIAKRWKQPKCPSTEQWIKCSTYIQ